MYIKYVIRSFIEVFGICIYLFLFDVDEVNRYIGCLDRRFVKIVVVSWMLIYRVVLEVDCCSDFINFIGFFKNG